MSEATTRIHCTIDLEAPGRRVGRLEVRHSDNRHAYGIVPVPIACIGGGRGPTALVTAGNHGDEHEGRIIARRLIRELDPAHVHGRLIVLPALNYPAVLADSRVSPIDGARIRGMRAARRPSPSPTTWSRCCCRCATRRSTCIPAARRRSTCRARTSSWAAAGT